MDSNVALLPPWGAFYGVIGTSAAALIGLMFVVVTLVGSRAQPSANADGISVFSTPTVIHFTCALLTAAIFVAPWPGIIAPAIAVFVVATVGFVYIVRAIKRSGRMREYTPDAEDYAWYALVPLGVYILLIAGALGLLRFSAQALYVVAFSVLALVALGIRNSWDVVTYIAVMQHAEDEET